MRRATWLVMGVGAGCAAAPAIDEHQCQFVRSDGMCEATVTLEPRESESPNEATTLIVRWEWQGEGDVPDRVVQTHMTAYEARALAESLDDLGESRCVVERAVAPPVCEGLVRIVDVEAEP